jgi:hypothetical protein
MQETLNISDFEIKEVKDIALINYKHNKGSTISFVGIELFGKKAVVSISVNKERSMLHNSLLFLLESHLKIPNELMEMANMISGDYNPKTKKFNFICTHGQNKEFFNDIYNIFKKVKPKLKPARTLPKIKTQKIKKRVL